MSALVVGLSYRTAPLDLLERAALDADRRRRLQARLCATEHIGEAVVLSTCNRLEVYAAADRFHGALAAVGDALHELTGLELTEITDHLYVHYEAAAVAHVFTLAAGLDSMAVGEQQILGQVRAALREAQDAGTAGAELVPLLQQALRVGKRAHAETDLNLVGRGLVEAALSHAADRLGPLSGARALVVGAGSMSGLAVATLRRHRIGALGVTSRTADRAARVAATAGGTAYPMAELDRALAEADVVLCCAGAAGYLVHEFDAKAALAARNGRPQVYLDLALPRDVDPRVADLDGAWLIDLEVVGRRLADADAEAAAVEGHSGIVADARSLVHEEVRGYLEERAAASDVGPTVVALRGMAASVVEVELGRLRSRLAGRTEAAVVAELEQTVHRVVEKLLHTPTVRVKQLATEPDGALYTQALRELFGLDPAQVAAVTAMAEPESGGPR